MLPRFHLSDLSTVGHHIGTLIVLVGILMCIPLAVALVFGEFASAVDFVFGIGCCMLVGALLRLLKARRVDRRCSLLLTGFSWLAVGLMAAIPMFLSGEYLSFIDALFDSVSSITTTGISLAANLDTFSYSQIVWHAVLTLAGGQAIIIIAVYMGFFGEGSFATVATTRGYSDLVSSEFARSSRFIWIVTGTFTVLGTLVAFGIGLFIGMRPADALIDAFCLAANASNTGGFVPHTSSLIYYHNVGIDGLVLVLIMLGGINMGIFSLAMKRRYGEILKNAEFKVLVLWTAVFIVCISVGMARDAIYTTLSGLVDRGMFMGLASIGTSGMQTVYPEQLKTCFSDGVLILLMLATFLGASACSTGGGVKILRVMEVLRWFGYTIFRAILPENARLPIRYYYFGTRNMTAADAMQAMTIMILYLAAGALGAMAFIAHGNDALASVFESISYICNSGITVGIMSPTAPIDLKLVAIAQMWAGRLEFIALIAALAGIVISLRPLHPNAGGGRAGQKALTPWHRLKQSRKLAESKGERSRSSRSEDGSARVRTLVFVLALCGMLVASPLLANAAVQTGSSAEQGGAEVSAADIESLKAEAVESYREMTIADLLGASGRLDGRRVEFTGTVYGAPIHEDKGKTWVNVKAENSMIGVTLSPTQVERIATYGGYWHTGDVVTIKGVFHHVCNKHHGELDVHGISLEVTQESTPVKHPVSIAHLLGGIVLCILGGLAMLLKRAIYGKSRHRRVLFEL